MADVREVLETERMQAVQRLAMLRRSFDGMVAASRESNADDEHDPEGATIAYERSQLEALIGQAVATLTEIDAALSRLSAGDYGTCGRCGEPIPADRLAARPLARWCIGCAAGP